MHAYNLSFFYNMTFLSSLNNFHVHKAKWKEGLWCEEQACNKPLIN